MKSFFIFVWYAFGERKKYGGFEGVVLKIDGSINYTPVELSEVLSE